MARSKLSGVAITDDARAVDPAAAAALYVELGWGMPARYSAARLRRSLAHCDVVLAAHDEDGALVAVLRALTDRAIDTKVLDLVIAPEYQRQGLGLAMMKRLARHPAVKGTTIYFETEKKNFAFAAKAGYVKRGGLTVFKSRRSSPRG
jgi:ribosomal protein S18 acetylase RimI-like enzyme